MFKAIQKSKAKKGFTLVELLVVIAIIAILMLVLVPSLLAYINNANKSRAETNAKMIYDAAIAAYTDKVANGSATVASTDLSSAVNNTITNFTGKYSIYMTTSGQVDYVVWAADKDTLDNAPHKTKNGDTDGKWARWPKDSSLNP